MKDKKITKERKKEKNKSDIWVRKQYVIHYFNLFILISISQAQMKVKFKKSAF